MSNLPTQYNHDDFGNLTEPPKPIRCTIGQPTSRGQVEQGKFNFKNKPDWEATALLRGVVLLKPHATYVLYGETFDSPARCGSDNHNTPSQRVERPINKDCYFCFANKWDNEVDSNGLALKRELEVQLRRKKSSMPLCADTVNLIVVDSRGIPYVLQAQKSQLKNVYENLINVLKYSGKRIFQTQFDIGLRKIENEKGTYYEYTFGNFSETQGPLLNMAMGLYDMFRTGAEQILAEQHAAMDAEKTVEPAKTYEEPAFQSDEEIPF